MSFYSPVPLHTYSPMPLHTFNPHPTRLVSLPYHVLAPKHTNTKICFVMFFQNISLATKTYKNTNTKICFVMFLQNISLAPKTYKNTNTKICFLMFFQNISPTTRTYEHTTHYNRKEYYSPFTHNLSYFVLPHQTVDVGMPAHLT